MNKGDFSFGLACFALGFAIAAFIAQCVFN